MCVVLKCQTQKIQTHHCFQFVVVLNPRVLGVPGKQPEPCLQVENIAPILLFSEYPIKSPSDAAKWGKIFSEVVGARAALI